MRKLAKVGVLLLLTSGCLVLSPDADAAYSPCTGMSPSTPGAYQNGLFRDHGGQNLRAVKAYVETYNPAVISSTTPPSASAAWPLMRNTTYSSLIAYAQVGWVKTALPPTQGQSPNPARANLFVEIVSHTNVPFRAYFGELEPGNGDVYRLYEVNTNRAGVWDFYVDGSNIHHISDAGDPNDWAPNRVILSAETHQQPTSWSAQAGDQTAGDRDEWVGFHEVKIHINGAWVFEDFNAGGPSNGYYEMFPSRMTTNENSTTKWFWYKPYDEAGKSKEFDVADLRCPN